MPDSTTAPSRPEVDVVAVGNALVDVLVQVDDALLDRLGLTKGAMGLVDESRQGEIYAAVGAGIEMSGGSAANTAVCVASLGGSAQFVGRVRDDQLGKVFAHDLRAVGVGFDNVASTVGPATGSCLVLVTPDAQRTMNTHLGAAACFEPGDVVASVIARGSVVYLEGYLFDSPEAQDAFRRAAAAAHAAGREVALSLSDSFCVERHREAFDELIDDHIDLLFANESEALAQTKASSFEEAVARLAGRARVTIITRSEAGAVAVTGSADEFDLVEVASVPVAVEDATGAGDAFAAGFLFGYTRGQTLARSLHIGAIAASEVISHIGPRPQVALSSLLD